MSVRLLPFLIFVLALPAQHTPPPTLPEPLPPQDVRLPNGKLQRDEILKEEHAKSLEDAKQLVKLVDELKSDLEKNDQNVLPLATLKKTEEIEKLAKKIHDRLKH